MTDTKTCPYCAEEIRSEAVKCRFCGSRLDGNVLAMEWTRREEGKMIAGVCAGLADQFDISVTVVRLAFALACIIGGGVGIVVYVLLWIIMPMERNRRDLAAG
jgi:phage shock protein PspC (stress-responsive transcriptional regulator)